MTRTSASNYCESCHRGTWACVCNLSYAQRLRSVHIDVGALETRSRKKYYDREPLKELFGSDAKERYQEETKGRGALYSNPDSPSGFVWRNEKERRLEPVTASEAKETLPNLLGD